MRAFVFIACIVMVTLCRAQSKDPLEDKLVAMNRIARRIDSLCTQESPRIIRPVYGEAKLCSVSPTDRRVKHKTRIYYRYGCCYQKDFYKDTRDPANKQKIRIYSINNKQVSARWKYSEKGVSWDRRMIRKADGTVIWNYSTASTSETL